MKRSELKQLMKEVYQRKLKEYGDRMNGDMPSMGGNDRFKSDEPAKPSAPASKGSVKYGYIAGEQGGEPIVQIVGYGKLKMEQVKHTIVDHISVLIKSVRDEKYDAALHVLEEKGILKLFLNALVEIGEGKEGLKEQDLTAPAATATAAAVAPINGAPQVSVADQQKLMKIEQDKAKATADMENIKGKLAKMTRPYTDKINNYEKKIADLNTASERIRK